MAHPAADPSSVSVWPSRHSQCPGVWDSRVVRVFEPGSCRVRSARSYGIRDLIWAMRGSMLPAPLGGVDAAAAAGPTAAGGGTLAVCHDEPPPTPAVDTTLISATSVST